MESKISKYLLYAIGEIALVMIGILLALQVNNWNEERKSNQLELLYLKALKAEIEHNQTLLKSERAKNNSNIEGAKAMAAVTGPKEPVISNHEFGQIASKMLNTEIVYDAVVSVMDEMENSGKLGVLNDSDLKQALTEWKSLLANAEFQEMSEIYPIRRKIIELVAQHSNFREITQSMLITLDVSKSKFPQRNLSILQMQEFENLVIQYLISSSFLESNYYTPL